MPHAVLTRDPEGAHGYAAALAPLGLDVVALPVTRFAPAADPDALRRALAGGGYAAIVVASAHAAQQLAAARDAAGIADLPEVWAVGAATKRALAAARIAATHPDGVASGAELAHRVVASARVAGARVLLPRAEDGRPEAAAILRAAGAVVDDVIAYRTLPTPAADASLAPGLSALRARTAAVVCMFAPSQVSALAALIDLRALGCPVVAIGHTTAATARAAGIAAAALAVAAAPTPEGIANAVASVYRSPS